MKKAMRKYINLSILKTIKLVFHGIFCNSQRRAKSNTMTKLNTKNNTVSEKKFCCKNKFVRSSIGHKVHNE